MQRVLGMVLACLLWATTEAQFSSNEIDNYDSYLQGVSHFQSRQYGMAQAKFEDFLKAQPHLTDHRTKSVMQKAELYQAKCALYSGSDLAEGLFVNFIKTYSPSPEASEANYDLANYYFSKRKYRDALKYYEWLDDSSLASVDRNEFNFKKGYAHFTRKNYEEALRSFARVTPGDMYTDAQYYAGNCYYELKDYPSAVAHWKQAAQDDRYKESADFSIAQLQFAEGKYEEVIAEASQVDSKKYGKEVDNLLGKSYFEKGDYKNARIYLEDYAKKTRRLTLQEYYQLGYCRYLDKDYKEAAEVLVKLDKESSPLGQNAMYYLADCYTQLGQTNSARNAFYRVAEYNDDKTLQELALINFAKLSAEQNLDNDALSALSKIPATSSNYAEAQDLMADILRTTSDTKTALSIIEKMNPIPANMKATYQSVAYQEGLRLLKKQNPTDAANYFTGSLKYPEDKKLVASAHFWMAELYYHVEEYNKVLRHLKDYFQAGGTRDADTHKALAYYNQAYTFMKMKQYNEAEQAFQNFFSEVGSLPMDENKKVDMVANSGLRLGDCYYVQKNYSKALSIYEENIAHQYDGYDYALYQKGNIEGLQNNLTGKVRTLDQLVSSFPRSQYADDALLEQGNAYLEMKNYPQAIASLNKLVSDYQGKSSLLPKAYSELGLVYYNQGDVNKALSYYKKIFQNNPSSQEAKNALNAIEEIYIYDLKDPAGYEQFLRTVPGYKNGSEIKSDSLNYVVAYIQYENGSYDEANSLFDKYLRSFPKGFYVMDAHYYKGESQTIMKQYQSAVKEYEYCIDNGPNKYYEKALYKAALIHYNSTLDFRKAYSYYTTLEGITGNSSTRSDCQIGAFRAAYRMGNKEATEKYAQLVIRNNPSDASLKSTAQLYLSKTAMDKGDQGSAINYLSEAIPHLTGEDLPEARYLLALAYYQSGDQMNAKNRCQEAYKLSSGYEYWVAKSLILYSDILVKDKDFFNAKAALDAVIENYPSNKELLQEAKRKKQVIQSLEGDSYNISPTGEQ